MPGRGVAYSTGRPEHLLNVPARRMSAFPDEPDHFARWYGEHGGDAEEFAPRMLYGDYLEEQLAGAGERLEIVRGEAVDSSAASASVRLAGGRTIEADAVDPRARQFQAGNSARDRSGALGSPVGRRSLGRRTSRAGLGRRDTILLLGTGLTAVDAMLTLDAAGFGGRIVAVSRRGLAPRGHAEREPTGRAGRASCRPTCVGLLRRVRERSERDRLAERGP